jgi:hypothetical protein
MQITPRLCQSNPSQTPNIFSGLYTPTTGSGALPESTYPSLFSSSMLPGMGEPNSSVSMLSTLYSMPTPTPQPGSMNLPNSTTLYSALQTTPDDVSGTSFPLYTPPISSPLPPTTSNPGSFLNNSSLPASSQISFLTQALPNNPLNTLANPNPTPTPAPTPAATVNPYPVGMPAEGNPLTQMITLLQQLLGGGTATGAATPNNNVLVDAEKIRKLEEASNKEGIKGNVLENGGGPDNLIGHNDLDAIIKNGKESGLDDETIALAKEMKAVLTANPKASWLSS